MKSSIAFGTVYTVQYSMLQLKITIGEDAYFAWKKKGTVVHSMYFSATM
jgi:hypothetical protein